MTRATKAALLSALVFPGLGHLYLKRWVTGVVLAGVAGFALSTIVSIVQRVTREVARQVESGAVGADVYSLTTMVTQQMHGSEQAANVASTALLACWLIGIVGAYLQGRLQDKRDTPA